MRNAADRIPVICSGQETEDALEVVSLGTLLNLETEPPCGIFIDFKKKIR
ncbi:hypothetical protein QUF80_19500 [Desulfococcaceae bacterium HSG8]|nr:hypothetical protein [Desulfococcaceae bacterium HSG8]